MKKYSVYCKSEPNSGRGGLFHGGLSLSDALLLMSTHIKSENWNRIELLQSEPYSKKPILVYEVGE